MDDLHQLERLVEGRTGRQPAVLAQPVKPEDRFQTQLEMNEAAAAELRILDAELRDVVASLELYLEPAELARFRHTQGLWQQFRDLHAQSLADLFAGGSMQPLWYITCVDTATRDRLEELRIYLEQKEIG